MNSSFIFLSHTLSSNTPGYGGKKDFTSRSVKSIRDGGSCNQSEWQFNNHIGTHIDAPFHFSDLGKTLDQYPAQFWIFHHPQLILIRAEASQIIEPNIWCDSIATDTDLLLLKTDFEQWREDEKYWAHNPGLSPDLGLWLRKNRPQLKIVGLDFISITSYDHRPLGKAAHQAFLHESYPGTPLLVIEDMHLRELKTNPRKVIVSPLRVEKADGSPVTVMAEI